MLFGTVVAFKTKVMPFDLGQPIQIIVLLYGAGDAPIQNYDGNTIGIPLQLPWDVAQSWGGDDTVVEDFVLESCGFVRV